MGFARIEVSRVQLAQRDPQIPLRASRRLVIDGALVTDCLFDAPAGGDPIQVAQCRTCGEPWCEDGNAVIARRVGEAVAWLIPPERGHPAHGSENRFAPLSLVNGEPMWFRLSDYLARFELAPSQIPALAPEEGPWLLRCALRPVFGLEHAGPPTFEEIEAALLFRAVEPEGHALGAFLLQAVDGVARGLTFTEVTDEMPAAPCRLMEGFDLPGYPTPTRAVVTEDTGANAVWWSVGRGCWARR